MAIENQLKVLRGASFAVRRVMDVWLEHPDDASATFRTLEVLHELELQSQRAQVKAAAIIADDFKRARAIIATATPEKII